MFTVRHRIPNLPDSERTRNHKIILNAPLGSSRSLCVASGGTDAGVFGGRRGGEATLVDSKWIFPSPIFTQEAASWRESGIDRKCSDSRATRSVSR